MIAKTEAIALRIVPYSRTSHVVTWLSPDRGKVVTVVKGANRPKSDFLGQYDLFQTCELVYYTRDRNGLHIARECAPLTLRAALHTDWRAAALASYACDVVWRVSPEGGIDNRVYALLQSLLDTVAERSATPEALFWFELALFNVFGTAPQLTACSVCGSQSVQTTRGCAFGARRGGLICRACRTQARGELSDITPAVLALLQRWQNDATGRSAYNARCTRQQYLELRHLLGVFLAEHLDVLPDSRAIACDILRG